MEVDFTLEIVAECCKSSKFEKKNILTSGDGTDKQTTNPEWIKIRTKRSREYRDEYRAS
jgi:hypothetical protein